MTFALVLGLVAVITSLVLAAVWLLRGAESASSGFHDEYPESDEMFRGTT